MVHRSSRGQFSALIAKSCIKQVGGAGIGELLCCSRLFSLRVWLALSTAASEVKVPIQPFCCCCCCCDTISKHRSSSTAPAAAKPRNVSAKLSPAAAAKSCHQQLQSCQAVVTRSPFHTFSLLAQKPFDTSLVDHLSSSCQSQALAAETFEKK